MSGSGGDWAKECEGKRRTSCKRMEADLTEQRKKNVIDKRVSCQKDSLLQKIEKMLVREGSTSWGKCALCIFPHPELAQG